MPITSSAIHLPRLQAVLTFLKASRLVPGQLNLATYMATHRTDEDRAPVGCVLGHYARSGQSSSISLIPINYKAQVKSPVMADILFEEYPHDQWRHWTLRYQTLKEEAYGETAAGLWLQMGRWDIHRLFYPAGSSYEIRPPIESLVWRLNNMVETT